MGFFSVFTIGVSFLKNTAMHMGCQGIVCIFLVYTLQLQAFFKKFSAKNELWRLCTGIHKGFEYGSRRRVNMPHAFGVPLYAQKEGMVFFLKGFNEAGC